LDHLIWQLVAANGGTPGRDHMFPICTFPPTNKAQFKDKVRGIDPAAEKLIDVVQPYRTSDDSLWFLTELDNIDKHRLLLVTAMRQQDANAILDLGQAPPVGRAAKFHQVQFLGSGDLQDGTPLARIIKTPDV